MENLFYWITEYFKVMVGYGFVMFIWPSIVFRKYLKGKSMTFRFGFCVTVPIIIMNTVVLLLGILHILNKLTIWLFFYGVLLYSCKDKLKIQESTKRKFKYLITGTFGWKHFLLLTKESFISNIKNGFKQIHKFYKKNWMEYSLLLIAVLYGMLYFSWASFVEPAFAFSDVYVHHSWIYGLVEGKPFVDGIYPEGMHCVIYVMNTLFNIRIYSVLLFIPGINIALTIVAAYCFMNYIFKWRFTPIFALYAFLTLELTNHFLVKGMARAQCALPQEFSFPAIFICGLFFLRYLTNNTRTIIVFEKHKSWCFNGELLIFIMSVATTIAIHFFSTIMAVYVCFVIAIVYWRRIFSRTHFIPLLTAAILGLFIAAIPMGIGYMSGIPIQSSLNWAMSVISDSSSEEENTEEINADSEETELNYSTEVSWRSTKYFTTKNDISANECIDGGVTITVHTDISVATTVAQYVVKIKDLIFNKLLVLYECGYSNMYEKTKALFFIFVSIFVLLFWLLYRLISLITKRDKHCFDNYLVILGVSLVYVISFCAEDLGLPVILLGDRSAFIGHFFMMMLAVILFDIIFVLFDPHFSLDSMEICSVVTAVGIVVLICVTDNYHSYLYYEASRFASTVNITNNIMDSLPAESYTIVSPVEELYQVMGHGRHEEILTLCDKQHANEYFLPTEYVFIYVEKKPLAYSQYHFLDGPKWLADNEYKDVFSIFTVSVTPDYITSEISDELVHENIMYFSKLSDSYLYLSSRTILMSKIYDWCQRFNKIYPNELKTYYEDEYIVCYYFRQNTDWLYNLVIE